MFLAAVCIKIDRFHQLRLHRHQVATFTTTKHFLRVLCLMLNRDLRSYVWLHKEIAPLGSGRGGMPLSRAIGAW
jgi:hypothetical protein